MVILRRRVWDYKKKDSFHQNSKKENRQTQQQEAKRRALINIGLQPLLPYPSPPFPRTARCSHPISHVPPLYDDIDDAFKLNHQTKFTNQNPEIIKSQTKTKQSKKGGVRERKKKLWVYRERRRKERTKEASKTRE